MSNRSVPTTVIVERVFIRNSRETSSRGVRHATRNPKDRQNHPRNSTPEPFPLSPSSFAHHGNSDTQLILIDITQPRRTSNSCNSRAPPCPRLSLGGSCWQAPTRSHFSHPATSPYPSLLRNLSPNALDLPTSNPRRSQERLLS